jgi:hypothetical protein
MWQAMRGKSFDSLRLRVSEAVAEGYPMSAVLSQLQSDVIYKQGLTNTEKALFCEKIANVSISSFSRNFYKCSVFIFLRSFHIPYFYLLFSVLLPLIFGFSLMIEGRRKS